MADSILSRLARLFKAQTHDALDVIEDPGAIARQMVRDLSVSIKRHEESTAKVVASQKLLQGRVADAEQSMATWTEKARQAVVAQRDDLAEEALRRVETAERNRAAFSKSLDILNPQVEALKRKLDELRVQHDEAENEAILFDARAKAAEASGDASRLLGSVGENPVDFSSLRNRVAQMEATSAALDDLSRDKSGAGLSAELEALGSPSTQARLEALKQEVADQQKAEV